jgi:hypothetical protein
VPVLLSKIREGRLVRTDSLEGQVSGWYAVVASVPTSERNEMGTIIGARIQPQTLEKHLYIGESLVVKKRNTRELYEILFCLNGCAF